MACMLFVLHIVFVIHVRLGSCDKFFGLDKYHVDVVVDVVDLSIQLECFIGINIQSCSFGCGDIVGFMGAYIGIIKSSGNGRINEVIGSRSQVGHQDRDVSFQVHSEHLSRDVRKRVDCYFNCIISDKREYFTCGVPFEGSVITVSEGEVAMCLLWQPQCSSLAMTLSGMGSLSNCFGLIASPESRLKGL